MRKTIIYILAIVLNIGVYVLFSIIDVFVDFLVFGEGASSGKYSFWISLCFLLLQLLILLFMYKKKVLVKDITLLILNVLIVVCLFLYFVVYLSST
ncbi:hypothetical protein [Pedobacter sp. B4-66]|uniref:hypothetical protein n=1 Tax=Pedobacter sp. B4-66 TaxID=2817280 RepID=UPI001BDAB2DB|nr:hypothetical protein [Pedobacter sp. B4-66]